MVYTRTVSEDVRRRILERRAAFVAAAISSMSAAALASCERTPDAVGPVDAEMNKSHDAGTTNVELTKPDATLPEPQVCLSPMPCLTVTPPHDARPPWDARPHACLSKPWPCLQDPDL